MQHWHVYQKWNARLFRGCTAFLSGRCDNDPSVGWYQENSASDHYIIPLAMKLKSAAFRVSSDEYLSYATNNRREWG
jgi:hypothetical protein